jgi:hypothetical protein
MSKGLFDAQKFERQSAKSWARLGAIAVIFGAVTAFVSDALLDRVPSENSSVLIAIRFLAVLVNATAIAVAAGGALLLIVGVVYLLVSRRSR